MIDVLDDMSSTLDGIYTKCIVELEQPYIHQHIEIDSMPEISSRTVIPT